MWELIWIFDKLSDKTVHTISLKDTTLMKRNSWSTVSSCKVFTAAFVKHPKIHSNNGKYIKSYIASLHHLNQLLSATEASWILAYLPLGSSAHPHSAFGIQRITVLAAALDGNSSSNITR